MAEAELDQGWIYENQKTIAENQTALDQKLTNLAASLKDAMTPKEQKEADALKRTPTLQDLQNLKEETAKSVEEKLHLRDVNKQAEAEAEAEYDNTLTWAKELAEKSGAKWSQSREDVFNSLADKIMQIEVNAARREKREFNWDNFHEGVRKKFAGAMEWEESNEEETEEKGKAKEEIKEKAIKPGSLTGLGDEISVEGVKSGKLDELEKALASGKIKDYDELTRLHEQIMDVRNGLRSRKLTGGRFK